MLGRLKCYVVGHAWVTMRSDPVGSVYGCARCPARYVHVDVHWRFRVPDNAEEPEGRYSGLKWPRRDPWEMFGG